MSLEYYWREACFWPAPCTGAHSDPDFGGLGHFSVKCLCEFICSSWSRGRHSSASSQAWSTACLFKSGDRRRKGKEPRILHAFQIFSYFGLEMHQRNVNKEKIGGFYLGNQALFKFTRVDSVWKIKASLSGRACWWPSRSLSTGPLMGI